MIILISVICPIVSWSNRKERSQLELSALSNFRNSINTTRYHVMDNQKRQKNNFFLLFLPSSRELMWRTREKNAVFPRKLLILVVSPPVHTEFTPDWGDFCMEKMWFSCVTKVNWTTVALVLYQALLVVIHCINLQMSPRTPRILDVFSFSCFAISYWVIFGNHLGWSIFALYERIIRTSLFHQHTVSPVHKTMCHYHMGPHLKQQQMVAI